jgi:hypothetical protein
MRYNKCQHRRFRTCYLVRVHTPGKAAVLVPELLLRRAPLLLLALLLLLLLVCSSVAVCTLECPVST